MGDDRRYPAILLFGYPGSGKGTQGVVLGHMPNLLHLAMGDIFRALDKASDMGKEFLSYSTKGLLVPDEFTVRLWQQHVAGLQANGRYKPGYHTLHRISPPTRASRAAASESRGERFLGLQ